MQRQRLNDATVASNGSARPSEPAAGAAGETAPPVQRAPAGAPAAGAAAPAPAEPPAAEAEAPAEEQASGSTDVNALFKQLYPRVRDELRWELRVQRERAGLLSDPL